MCPFLRFLAIAVLVFTPACEVLAQTRTDASGHWTGIIRAPEMAVDIAIDLARDQNGQLVGTFTEPAENIKGMPLSSIVVQGRTIEVVFRPGMGGGTFRGEISADGQSITGDFIANQGGYVLPFTVERKGEAQIVSVAPSAPIAKPFEGRWNGSLSVLGQPMRVMVTMTNHADGTASGTVASPDGTGVEIPIAITQKGASLTIDVPAVGATYVGTLNDAATEMVGTWTQGAKSLPLTLRR